MKLLFVDSGGWGMLADEDDPQHRAAREARDLWLEGRGLLVCTDYVMDETLTLLRARLGLRAAAQWWDAVADSAYLRWERIGPERAERARHWFFRWSDKEFSFTDCTSFVVMKERRIKAALTNDRHFVQAGFQTYPPA